MTDESVSNNVYVPALDGIRALAACIIVLHHAQLPGLPGGYMAVDVFFVLSGFLITGILLRTKAQGRFFYQRFAQRRLCRLWPALLVFLVFTVLTAPFLFEDISFAGHLRAALFTAGYFVNYTGAFTEPMVLGHIWTLAVEMQFYLIWPLVVVVLVRVPQPTAIAGLLLLFLLATASRWLQSTPDDIWSFYIRTDARASGLTLGSMLAFVQRRVPAFWAYVGVLLLAFAMTFYSTRWLPSARYGFTIAELGAALLVLAQPSWLAGRFWSWLATLSYSWYLWHYYFMLILQKYQLHWSLVLIIGGGCGLLVAWLSHRWVEQRFYRSRRGGLAKPEGFTVA